MENDKICVRAMKCPIFNGVLESKDVLVKTFKNLYCENGIESHEKCKRYQVAAQAGSCPQYVLPNSPLTVEEIILRMEQNK